jgi:glycosyltransferase involved in cell wall biosynthesis
MNNKIGIGIITCNRPAYLRRAVNSFKVHCKTLLQNLIVVNDGSEIAGFDVRDFTVLQNEKNLGVGKSKNRALQYMLDNGSDYLFIMEDDVMIQDGSVFESYIKASRASGIQHFNFAFHGQGNYDSNGNPNIRLCVEYPGGVKVCLYPNVYGAFSFYTRKCIEEVGLMDEFYYNAMEHVDHTNLIIQKAMHPPFRWFADISDSQKFLTEVDSNHEGSEIRKSPEWLQNFHKAANYFAEKFGFDVRDPKAIVASREEVVSSLQIISKIHGNE